jgi:hypothetical protein
MISKILGFLFKKKELYSKCIQLKVPVPPKTEIKEYNCCGGKVKVTRPLSNKRKSKGKK